MEELLKKIEVLLAERAGILSAAGVVRNDELTERLQMSAEDLWTSCLDLLEDRVLGPDRDPDSYHYGEYVPKQ